MIRARSCAPWPCTNLDMARCRMHVILHQQLLRACMHACSSKACLPEAQRLVLSGLMQIDRYGGLASAHPACMHAGRSSSC